MIAVTGMGVVSPFGVGLDEIRRGMYSGQVLHAEAPFDPARYGLKAVGSLKNFVPTKHIPAMKARRMSRLSQIGLISAQEAWNLAGVDASGDCARRCGVIVGTGLGSVSSTDSFFEGLVLRGPHETNPMIFPETVQNIAAAHISIELGLKGPNTTFSQGDVASEYAVHYSVGLLKAGLADAVLVCGVDELTEPLVAGLKALRLTSRSGRLAPFDRRRDGIVPAEGGAALVLERAEDAKKRNARIFGYIAGFGAGGDPVERFSYAGTGSMARTMDHAVKESGIMPDFISSSANSSVELDRNEASAIRSVFGSGVPVTSLKSRTGSFMASGIMRIAAALISIGNGMIPPVCGLVEPEIDGIDYVVGSPRPAKAKTCLVNGFSHGGANVCLVVTGPEP
jgi:3-oxoacyl-(acyl-carrier-protein) synthase